MYSTLAINRADGTNKISTGTVSTFIRFKNSTAVLFHQMEGSEVTASMKLRIVFAILALVVFERNVFSKPWRGIVPLISTRSDVERLLGKPNDSGLYELNGEAASVIYSDGPCQGLYRSLEKANCKC